MSLIAEQDEKRVQAAVADVEKHTAGEIVIVVARRSHDYAYWRFIATLAAGFAATAIAAWIWTFELHAHPGWETYSTRATVLLVLVAQALFMALFWLLFRTGASIRRIVPEGMLQTATEGRAHQTMIEHGVTETRDRSGILIYVSELEHRVVIVGDTGIFSRLGADPWGDYVKQIVAAIREGKAAEGLLQVLAEMGEQLAKHFPAREDDENELPNAIRRPDL
jgi:putative membrane protein